MAIGLIDGESEPTEAFDNMVRSVLDNFLVAYRAAGKDSCGFVVPAVMGDHKISYWGILDMQQTPEEDLYIEVWRRFHSAIVQLGEPDISGFGIVDIHQVMNRNSGPGGSITISRF